MKTSLHIIIFSIFTLFVKADEKFQINGMIAPSYEGISMRNKNILNPFLDYRLSYNIGGEIKYFLTPKMSTNIGLQFNDKGFTTKPAFEYYGDTITSTVNISLKYLSIPFDLCFNFQPAYRTEIFFNVGLTYGILIHQSFKGKRIPTELGRPDDPIFEGVSNERTNIDWFDKSYVALNAGIGVSRYIQSRLVFTVHPYIMYQFDQSLNPDGPIIPFAQTIQGETVPLKPGFNTLMFQLKLGYYFSDQIENTKKKI